MRTTETRQPSLARSMTLVMLCALVAGAAMLPRPAAAARSGNRFPSTIRALALPRSTFPHGAVVTGGRANNRQAERASQLHATPFASLGRMGGYAETARWRTAGHAVSLRYIASVFRSVSQAALARAEALASVWELGRPDHTVSAGAPAFDIEELRGWAETVMLVRQGQVEAEIILRYSQSSALKAVIFRYLRRAAKRASGAAHRYASTSPAHGTPPPQDAPYVAPWGTGPIVKSPSLMVADPALVPSGTSVDPGSYRRNVGSPLRSRVSAHTAIGPSGSLSRYVRTASIDGRPIYDTAALYSTPSSAADALTALATANTRVNWLQLYQPRLLPSTTMEISQAMGWHGGGENVVGLRIQNVAMVLAGASAADLESIVDQLVKTVPTWLHAQGTEVVDTGGNTAHLSGLNWYGAEENDYVVGGLDYRSYQSILSTVKQAGFNAIRLPFSNQLVEGNPVVTQHLAANPELVGLHALDILDRIIAYAGALGIAVILDDHRSEAGWSSEQNGLWYTAAYPDSAFEQDWVTMVRRYAVNNVVVGVDLRNEPHGSAAWGNGDPSTDWEAAAQRAGNAVLATNPHLLIIVEGVQYYGSSGSYWWGGNLMGVATSPIDLRFVDGGSAHSQLVYSAHDYGPDNCGSGCPWFNSSTTYASLSAIWDQYWGYITADPSRPYAAPVWVGEFGTCNGSPSCVVDSTPGSQGQWFSSLVRYLGDKRLGWAYWSLNGSQSTGGTRVYGTAETYGFLQPNWIDPNPWLVDELRSIQNPEEIPR